MFRAAIIMASVILCLLLGTRQVTAQASEQLKQKTKEMESAQKKSWQQVDEINKEADNTRARLQQARQSGEDAKDQPGYTTKKTQIGTKGAYKKTKPPKSGATKKK
jgi:uncharacterized membrane protein YhiD involved in acid resistance